MSDEEQEAQYYEELIGHDEPEEIGQVINPKPYVPSDPERPF